MRSLEIIHLRTRHYEMLLQFFDEINCHEYTKNFSPHPLDKATALAICNYEGRDLYYAVLLNGMEIIAYGMLRGWDEGYEIPSIGLCVLKKYKRLRLGKTIMRFLETVAIFNGATETMLKVKKSNGPARDLYVGLGYIFEDHNNDFLIGYKTFSKDEEI